VKNSRPKNCINAINKAINVPQQLIPVHSFNPRISVGKFACNVILLVEIVRLVQHCILICGNPKKKFLCEIANNFSLICEKLFAVIWGGLERTVVAVDTIFRRL
jgi:hypothetical protein